MALRHGEISAGLGYRVRLPAQERALLAATDQETIHDPLHDKSLINKEKGQVTQQDTQHDTQHDSGQVTDQVE